MERIVYEHLQGGCQGKFWRRLRELDAMEYMWGERIGDE